MPARTTNNTAATDPEVVRRICQPDCIVARPRSEGGYGMRFTLRDDGSVEGAFPCEACFQGYPDRLHGGVAATLLDAVMSNCLFARRVRGMTARLNIRYREAVELDQPAVVRGWIVRAAPPLYELKAELRQGDKVRALAEAKFFGETVA